MKSSSIFRSIVAAVTMTFGLSTSSAFADCPADLNGDHRVDGADLSILLNDWNSVSTPQFDLNHDGTINGADLAVLIGHWGPCGFGATQGITLVIDPTDLNLLHGCPGCSAWVVGYANVNGGGTHGLPFRALTSSAPNVASFEEQTGGHLQMIQIYGGNVTGTTTISTGTAEMDGGQLQIFVSSSSMAPTGPTAIWGSPTTVTVTQVNSPPYAVVDGNQPVPFDIVEFAYIPNSFSTFDLTAVNGFAVPMTMTPQQNPPLGSVGIQPIQSNPDPTYTNISRQMIGTAYTTFMAHDPQGAEFQRLLYDVSSGLPATCYETAPSAPASQFFAIVNPWFWLSRAGSSCTPPGNLANHWHDVLGHFFVAGNTLKIDIGRQVIGVPTEYTGTCAQDPTNNGVLTYTFQDQNNTSVLNTNTNQPLKLPQPTAAQEAGFVFGNTADIFPGVPAKFPGADGGLIIGAIMQALNRGVALDGLNPASIDISTATSSFLKLPLADPMGVATITTTSPHGIPQGRMPDTYKMNITGVNVPGYNGTLPITPFVLTGVGPTTFTFQYLIATNENKSVMDGGNNPTTTYDPSTDTTVVTVTVVSGSMPMVGQVVYFVYHQNVQFYTGQHTVTGVTPNTITINLPGNHLWSSSSSPAGGIIWSGLYADGAGGTVTPVGASSVAWNNSNNWYGAPGNLTHTRQPYNTYSKFLHYSTIGGTDSRLGGGTPIFINNQAYGFALDEQPSGPYAGQPVPAKFDQTILDGSTINLTLSPWTFTPKNP